MNEQGVWTCTRIVSKSRRNRDHVYSCRLIASTVIQMAVRESNKAGEEKKTKTGWMNGADRNYEIATKVEQVWVALAAGRSVVSRFGDSKYRGTRAQNEARVVAIDQKTTCTGTFVKLITLTVANVLAKPIQTFIETISRGCACGLKGGKGRG
jgi:hypothetical protein